MSTKRKVEIFTAGCPVCDKTVQLVQKLACPSCDVTVADTRKNDAAERAKALGIRSLPAVLVNGVLADCCAGRGPNEATLRSAGIGVAVHG